MTAPHTEFDPLALAQSIHDDIETCRERNTAELHAITRKLNDLVDWCRKETHPARRLSIPPTSSVQSAPGSPHPKLKKEDPCTPQSIQRLSDPFRSERKPKPTDDGALHGFWKELSEKKRTGSDHGPDTGRVSFTAQELFPENTARKSAAPTADALHRTPLPRTDDFPRFQHTPKAHSNVRAESHAFTQRKSTGAVHRTPFAASTPFSRTPFSGSSQRLSASPIMAIESILPMDSLHEIADLRIEYANGRPKAYRTKTIGLTSPSPQEAGGPISETSCQVLVEFKRNRVYQYDSPRVISPGEYAIVSGDRGDDLGLVIYSWYSTADGVHAAGIPDAAAGKNIGLGVGKVVRAATEVEVNIVHNALKDLEVQALEACRSRVRDLGLPMAVVDAEYQYDRKKLTFFYQCEHRQDFRELIRDLYRTFKARIWMENVDD
ncbi:hypothetical protein XU18_2374 [Perkinsela sp. CCAP 1560/4]|nr:hypothetical protein XU18_2374 [Perkinsela sp. CCAP 1560/4]|eukprot:KNH06864.1 hypothetical protein XU18_2374 [Perkinsela sp. CCAP 1560/4]